VNSYFDELEKVITKYNLKDKPHLIFNVDEKGIQQNHSHPSVVAGHTLAVQEVVLAKSSTTTVLGCGSAAGVAIPPFFVFE
jgi:lipocalin